MSLISMIEGSRKCAIDGSKRADFEDSNKWNRFIRMIGYSVKFSIVFNASGVIMRLPFEQGTFGCVGGFGFEGEPMA
jgi:hypothetical protein